MTCPRCGVESDGSARQCSGCGEDLGGPRPGDRIAARWEVLSRIGSGGMGVVYKALDRELDEVVALKVLRGDLAHSEEMARRFRSEIKLARRVRHPNVCAIHEWGQDGALRFIVMEFVEGVDLKRVLAGGLPHGEALEVGTQIAAALHAIHQAGIVHRDLKPANVMLDGQGRVRLMDFGIAKQFGAEHGSGLTATGHIVGTPEYMSPEQVRGEALDVRSDVYSLGTVLFEAFTGRVPFRGNTAMATLYATVHDPVPVEAIQAARVPGPVTQVLLRALAKLPAERYASAAELEKALVAARGAAAAAPPQRPHTIALVRSALALEPEAVQETTPLPALPPTPVPAAVATAVATVERRAYGGPSPRERAASRAVEEAVPRRGGLVLAVVALAIAGGGAAAWKYEARLRSALGLDASPSPPPSAVALVTPASAAPLAVGSLPPGANIVPVAPTPGATPRPSVSASAAPEPAPTAAPATPAPSAAAPTPGPAPTAPPPAAPASVDRAEELFAQGRFASALAEAKAVLEREPGNTQAQQLAEDAEVELMVEKRLKEARDAAQAGDRDLAIEKLKLGLAAKPTDSRLLALWRELTSS